MKTINVKKMMCYLSVLAVLPFFQNCGQHVGHMSEVSMVQKDGGAEAPSDLNNQNVISLDPNSPNISYYVRLQAIDFGRGLQIGVVDPADPPTAPKKIPINREAQANVGEGAESSLPLQYTYDFLYRLDFRTGSVTEFPSGAVLYRLNVLERAALIRLLSHTVIARAIDMGIYLACTAIVRPETPDYAQLVTNRGPFLLNNDSCMDGKDLYKIGTRDRVVGLPDFLEKLEAKLSDPSVVIVWPED